MSGQTSFTENLTDQKELALSIATDPDHRFELAIALNHLSEALTISKAHPSEHRWKLIGDKALENWDINLATECFTEAGDLAALLLIHSSTNNRDGLIQLSHQATKCGRHNIAFASSLQADSKSDCVEILTKTDRLPEAALFARTYAPSSVSSCLA